MSNQSNFQTLRILSLLAILFIVVTTGYAWQIVPSDVDVLYRYDAAGHPISSHSKIMILGVLPIFGIVVLALQTLFSIVEPRRAHLMASEKSIGRTWIILLILFSAIQIMVLLMAMGSFIDTVRLTLAGISMGLIVTGNYVGKAQSNWFFGLRTPWTMESDLVWDKTHRLGGKLLILWGISFLSTILLFQQPPIPWVYSQLAGLVLTVVFLWVYSFVVWKHEHAKASAS